MGYGIYIHRKPHWADESNRIEYEEWSRVADTDPDLEPYDPRDDEADSPDPELHYKLKNCDFDNCFYYWPELGVIGIRRGYFEETLHKAQEIAEKMGAVIEGDDGEFYRFTETGREVTRDRPGPGTHWVPYGTVL
jgi:hypothetical protein